MIPHFFNIHKQFHTKARSLYFNFKSTRAMCISRNGIKERNCETLKLNLLLLSLTPPPYTSPQHSVAVLYFLFAFLCTCVHHPTLNNCVPQNEKKKNIRNSRSRNESKYKLERNGISVACRNY